MKIIGRTEAGARLVEISTEEMIALNAAAQTLNSISLNCVIVSNPEPLPPPAETIREKENKISPANPSPDHKRTENQTRKNKITGRRGKSS